MAKLIKLIKNEDEIVTSFIIDEKYEIRPDGNVYSPKFLNKRLTDYPTNLIDKDIKSLIKALWKD